MHLHASIDPTVPPKRTYLLLLIIAMALVRISTASELVDATRIEQTGLVERILSSGVSPNSHDPGECPALIEAASGTIFRQNLEIARLLLDRGATVDARCDEGRTALHRAAASGSFELVEILLKAGAKVDVRTDNEATALHMAVSGGALSCCEAQSPAASGQYIRPSNHILTVKLLLERVDPSILGATRQTALHTIAGKDYVRDDQEAAHAVEIVRLLLSAGVSPNAADESGRRPLHVVRIPRIAEALLDSGADANLKMRGGATPLHSHADDVDDLDIIRLLVEKGHANVDAQDDEGLTPIQMAHDHGVAAYLISRGATAKAFPPLHDAVARNDLGRLKELLRGNPDINAPNPVPLRSLHDVRRATALHWAVVLHRREAAALLIDAGADVDAIDAIGMTPVHWSVHLRDLELTARMVTKSRNLNLRDARGDTTLHLAVKGPSEDPETAIWRAAALGAKGGSGGQTGRIRLISMLLDANVDQGLQDAKGDTALHVAVRESLTEVVELLSARGAPLTIRNNEGETPTDLARKMRASAIERTLSLQAEQHSSPSP
jgi:cytohesin